MPLWGERVNAAAYREIVGALPRELTAAQQFELVEECIDRVIPNKLYFTPSIAPLHPWGPELSRMST